MMLLVAVLLVASGSISAAYAHTTVEAGKYSIEVGWGTEPPVVSYRNTIVFHVAEPGDSPGISSGVPHAFRDMSATIKFGGASKQLEISSEQRLGHYFAYIIPTSPGSYSVQLQGTLGGEPISLDVPVEDVEQTAILDFPPRAAGGSEEIGPIKSALTSLQREVSEQRSDSNAETGGAAYDLAVFGVSLGAAGVAVGAYAAIRRR